MGFMLRIWRQILKKNLMFQCDQLQVHTVYDKEAVCNKSLAKLLSQAVPWQLEDKILKSRLPHT